MRTENIEQLITPRLNFAYGNPNGEHNIRYQTTQQVASSKSATQTSLNPDIK